MKKNSIKNLIIRRVIPLACTLLLTGCGTTDYEMKEETAENPIVIEEVEPESEEVVESELEDVIEEETVSYDAIDENKVFFEKVLNEEVTWDDIVLTNMERGNGNEFYYYEQKLTEHMKQYFNNLSLEEQAVIDRLNVRKLGKTVFLSSIVTDWVENHTFSALYVEETDDLNWDILFDTLKVNFENYSQEQQEKWMNADSESMKELYEEQMLEELSDEDLESWIRELHAFILVTRENTPNIDMRRLACVLENYVVGYEKFSIFNFGALAQTSSSKMTYPMWFGYYPNLKMFEHTNYHEFYHLISSVSCEDEKNDLGKLWAAGISLDISLKYDEEFIKDHGMSYQVNEPYATYFPFYYSFYEEGDAESYSSSVLGVEPQTYFDKQFVNRNLELSLFLQKGFEKENLRKASLLHNPIAFVQQFPILNEFYNDEEEWFYTQLEMLECYNIIHDSNRLVDFYWDAYTKDPDSKDDTIKFRIPVLENYADLQSFRNFAWSLINISNTERKNITLEDCYYLLHLFEKRLERQREFNCKTHDIESMDTEAYLKAKEELLGILLEALKENYYGSFSDYFDYNFQNAQLSSAFTEEEKRYFATLYVEMDDYSRWITETYETDDFDKMKEYYIIP